MADTTKKIKKIGVYNGTGWDYATIDVPYAYEILYYNGGNVVYGQTDVESTLRALLPLNGAVLTSNRLVYTGASNKLTTGDIKIANSGKEIQSPTITGTTIKGTTIQAKTSIKSPTITGTTITGTTIQAKTSLTLNGSTYTALQKPIYRTTRTFSGTISSLNANAVTAVTCSLPSGSSLPNNIIARNIAGWEIGGGKCVFATIPNFNLGSTSMTAYVSNLAGATETNIQPKIYYEYLYTD